MTAFAFRPTLNTPDDDPYFCLGDVEGERTPAWATSQPASTLEHFGGTQFERDHDALTAIFDRPDRIPLITRRGQYLYNFWKDAGNPGGLRRRTTLTAYPPILLVATKRDDCVLPSYALKMHGKTGRNPDKGQHFNKRAQVDDCEQSANNVSTISRNTGTGVPSISINSGRIRNNEFHHF